MLSKTLGRQGSLDGREHVDVERGMIGDVAAAQYERRRPCMYEVRFDLELLDRHAAAADEPCAVIDISAARGQATLARREVKMSDLGEGPRSLALPFSLQEFRAVEYRVWTAGTASLRVFEPSVRQISDDPGPAPIVDPDEDTADPHILHQQVRAVLRLLRPQRVIGFPKIRMGNRGDGGYVCIDDFAGIDTAFSFGISDDISWDLAAADRGLTIYQFDHTVDDPAPADPRLKFERRMVGPVSGATSESIAALLARHDRRQPRPNCLLKMDIEFGEWDVVNATSSADMGRFSQILCELHGFQLLEQADFRRRIHASVRKLHDCYAVAHVHANICGGISNIGNVILPNVIEVCFVNRSLYELAESDELFPGPLDTCCDVNMPDMYLGTFRY